MVKKKKLSRNAIIGYPAGIITGVTYGLNPLFGKPLMDNGASIDTILFYRYFFAVVLLGGFYHLVISPDSSLPILLPLYIIRWR